MVPAWPTCWRQPMAERTSTRNIRSGCKMPDGLQPDSTSPRITAFTSIHPITNGSSSPIQILVSSANLPRPKMWRHTSVETYKGGVCRSENGGRTWKKSCIGIGLPDLNGMVRRLMFRGTDDYRHLRRDACVCSNSQ